MVYTTAKRSRRQRPTRQVRAASSARRSRVASAYKIAQSEHQALLRYLRTAVGILPKAECQLLLEFADIAKRKCERLRRTLRLSSKTTPSWLPARL